MKKLPLPFLCVLMGLAGCSEAAVPEDRNSQMASDAGAAERPQRIVSLNLCVDQLLLALADRDQIAGLTRNARDPEMSAAASEVKDLRILGNAAEEILDIDPDLVMGMPARRSAAMGALASRGYPSMDLQMARNLDDIYASIHAAAQAVGYVDRGQALVQKMMEGMEALPAPGRGRVAAFYQRRGFMTGTGTLIDDLMNRAGLVNLASQLDKPALVQLSIEEMAAAQPDFIILESSTARISDQGSEMLHHAALRHIPRIFLPHAWTVCGGPTYVDAARSLVQQISEHDRAESIGHR